MLPGCLGGCGVGAEFPLADAEPWVGLLLAGGRGAGGVGTDAVGGGGAPPDRCGCLRRRRTRARSLQTPREIPKGWPRRLRCRCR